MDEYRDVWTRAEGTTQILVIAVAIALLQTGAVFLASLSVLPYALAVPLAVLLGPAAVWGVGIGAVFYALAASGLGTYPLVLFLDIFVCALVGRELWNSLPNALLRRPIAAVLGIIPVTLVATVLGLGLAVVLSTAFVNLGFETVLPAVVSERLLLATVLGPVVLAVGYLWRPPEWDRRETPLPRWVGTMLLAGIILTGWLVGTTVFTLIRRDAQMFPEIGAAISGAVPPPLDTLVGFMFGPYGWVLTLVGAVGALVLVFVVLRVGLSWSRPARRAERDTPQSQDTRQGMLERFRS